MAVAKGKLVPITEPFAPDWDLHEFIVNAGPTLSDFEFKFNRLRAVHPRQFDELIVAMWRERVKHLDKSNGQDYLHLFTSPETDLTKIGFNRMCTPRFVFDTDEMPKAQQADAPRFPISAKAEMGHANLPSSLYERRHRDPRERLYCGIVDGLNDLTKAAETTIARRPDLKLGTASLYLLFEAYMCSYFGWVNYAYTKRTPDECLLPTAPSI